MLSRSIRRFLASAVVVAAAVSACDDNALEAEVRALGEGCLLDSECEADLVCVFRRCHIECVETPDCVERGHDTICVLGDKPTNVCLLPDELACQGTFDCPGDTVCARDDVCRDPCAVDTDCLAGQRCLKGTCADVVGEGIDMSSPLLDDGLGGLEERCRYNSECLSPLTCRGGICEQECLTDRDCTGDDRCVSVDGAMLPDALACVAPTSSGPNGPPHCMDGVLSGDETALDCGGSCHPCASGDGCTSGADCASGVCTGSVCQVANCSDGVRNGTETGVDCGGVCPNGCPAGTSCTGPADCMAPAICDIAAGLCVAPTCSDGVLNGSETSADCGGPECAPCGVSQACVTPGDCSTLVCVAGVCLNASCTDGIQNQGEADVDCGGSGTGCAPCGNGADCTDGADCMSQSCQGSICVAPSCSDGTQNGFELGIDCGGTCANGCADGTNCIADDDCEAGSGCHPQSMLCTSKRTLTVDITGGGAGTVASSPVGLIDCGANCAAEIFEGDTVDLVPTPGINSLFGGFGGDCSGPTCSITVGASGATVSATFTASSPGAANWEFRQGGIVKIWHANTDALGNLLVVGQTTAASFDVGCFGVTTSSQDIYISLLAPGPASAQDACIGAVIDGSPTSSNEAAIGVHTHGITGNLTVPLVSDDPHLSQLGPLPCEETSGSRLVIAEYPPDVQSAAVSARCYGPAFVGPISPVNSFRIETQAHSANDELYLAGTFEGTGLRLDDAPTPAFTATTVGLADGILVKYDSNRDVVASYTFGGTTNADVVWDMAVDDATGNVVLAAQGRGDIDFGNGITATDVGNTTQAFIILLDSDLVPIWAREIGSSTYDAARAVSFLPNGNVAAALVVSGVINFGDGTFSTPLPGAAFQDQDIGIVELNLVDGALAGNGTWRRYQSKQNDTPKTIWADPGTGEVVWSGMSVGPQVNDDWMYEGTLMDRAVWVAATPSLFAPPTWVNQTGAAIHIVTTTRPNFAFVSPVDQSVFVTSVGFYDWGLGRRHSKASTDSTPER